jgi:hypothetical protein
MAHATGSDSLAHADGTAGLDMVIDSDTGAPLDIPSMDCSLVAYETIDSRASATSIGVDTTKTATLCKSSDEFDWWTFTLSKRSYVGIEVLFAKDAQDVALELWDSATNSMIDRSQDGADIQAIHELLRPGTYEILVERRDGNPTYTLETYALSTATPKPLNDGATRVFCPRFDLDDGYIDAAPHAGLLEDFGVQDDPNRWEPAAMLVRILDDAGTVRLGWGPLDDDGCTRPVWTPSPTDTNFVLQYALWSHFVRPPLPETFMIVYDCEQMQPCVLQRPYFEWTTAQGAVVHESRFIASAAVGQQLREELLVYWASAFSESRITMGVDANLYARVLGSADQGGGQFLPCPSGYCPNGTTCETTKQAAFDHCRTKTRANGHLGGHPTIDIAASAVDGAKSSGSPTQKFSIAHEMGHLQSLWVAGFDLVMSDVNYGWCSADSLGNDHRVDSPEWQSAALIEGFADFYAVAVFNELEDGAWYKHGAFELVDVENDTMRFQAQCQSTLDDQMKAGKCAQPGDATMCTDAGASNEMDWAGTLWDFSKVVGESKLPSVLRLLSDAGQSNWDPGSTTSVAYENVLWAAGLRFPNNGDDFHAASQVNGTNR